MFKRNLLEAALKEKGKTVTDLAECLLINRATLYKKLAQISDFTRSEVEEIKDFLKLSVEETVRIFYAEEVA